MFQLEHKYYLYTLGFIPVFVLIYFLLNIWRKRALKSYGDILVIQQLFPDVSKAKRFWKFILFSFAFAFLILGIVNPQVGTKLEEVKRKLLTTSRLLKLRLKTLNMKPNVPSATEIMEK